MATKLYYYTTNSDYVCIWNTGLIWTCDGSYGDGVYLTDMPPNYGRIKICEHLYSGQKDKYPNTEVCLETSADKINAVNMYTISGHSIWVCIEQQLLFTSFELGHFSAGNSVWKKISLKSQFKLEHRLLCVTKSPVTQLKELIDRQGLMTDYKFSRRNDLIVCTATCREKSAEGIGRYQKSAKNEAAKCLIRQVLLAKPKIYSLSEQFEKDDNRKPLTQNNATENIAHSLARYKGRNCQDNSKENCGTAWCQENVGSKITKENLRESNVSTNQSAELRVCFLAENKIIDNLIGSLEDNRIKKSYPVSTHKNVSSENMKMFRNRVLGSEAEGFSISQKIHSSHNSVRNSVYTCGEGTVVNSITKKSIYLSNGPNGSAVPATESCASMLDGNKSCISLIGRLQDIQIKRSSPMSLHTQVPSRNIRNPSPVFGSEVEDSVVAEKINYPHNSIRNSRPFCSDASMANTVYNEKVHDSKFSAIKTTETRSTLLSENKNFLGPEGILPETSINQSLSVPICTNLISENMVKISGYDFGATDMGIVGSHTSHHSENSIINSGVICREQNNFPKYKHSSLDHMAKIPSYMFGTSNEDIIRSKKCLHPENCIITGNTCSGQDVRLSEPSLLMQKHKSSESMVDIPNYVVANGAIGSQTFHPIENHLRNSDITNRQHDIRINNSPPMLKYKPWSSENMVDMPNYVVANGAIGSQTFHPIENNLRNSDITNRQHDIRINNSSSMLKYKPSNSENMADSRSYILQAPGESASGSQKIPHQTESNIKNIETASSIPNSGINKFSSVPVYNHAISENTPQICSSIPRTLGKVIAGSQNTTHSEGTLLNKTIREFSPESSVSANQRADIRFINLPAKPQDQLVAQSTPASSHESVSSETRRSIFGPVTAGISGSATGLGRKPITIIPPEEDLESCLSGNTMSSVIMAGSCTKATGFQEGKDDAAVANPVGALQNLCAERGWSFPNYQEVPPVELDQGSFGSDCSLLGYCERGIGYSKKLAKHQAALKVLRMVRNFEINGPGR